MTDFPSKQSFWSFSASVCTQRRYIHTKDVQHFLDAVLESAERRVEAGFAGGLLWRAQRGARTIDIPIEGTDDSVEEPYPFPKERMKPIPGRAMEGRVNPKGIPFLYLATHRDTAIAEVRPWKGGVVSVGQFRLVRDVRLVNATSDAKRMLYFGEEPDPKKREEVVWQDIDRAFAAPTARTDDAAEYIPTQVLGELFRANGFDGVAYRSSYGTGHNVALFDPDLAAQVNCFVVRVKDINFDLQDEPHSFSVDD